MKKLLRKILFGLNIIAALALLIAYASVIINPEKIAFPAFFGLAYPYLLLVNIIFIIFWAVNFKREVFVSIIVIALGFNHFNNFIRFGKNETGEYDFSLMSYNIRLFNHYDTQINSEKDIMNYLQSNNPDILCLQEFYLNGPVSSIDRRFAEPVSKDYNVHKKFVRIKDDRYYGIITFSTFPVIARGDILHPNSASLSIYTDILIDTDTVRIYNNHLQSFKLRGMERSLLEEIYANDEDDTMKELRDLSFSLKQGFARRAYQARILKEHINSCSYPVIVCGDFNDTPISYTYHKIRKGLKDAFVESGSGAGFTYKGKYPSNRIDYILYDKKLISNGYTTDRVKHSDHYPITAYFRISD
ncbi:MAG: endonuclease/exonuclease/phosphatase family protein [Bacteroidales bacterium]|nr:endonuclease/exonuclease/phosphatase family protein [Bacteroidales bacterium]